jgi:hypothetical protein
MHKHHVTITIHAIIHLPVIYLKHDVSETGFCLRLSRFHHNIILRLIFYLNPNVRRMDSVSEYVPP